MWGYLEHLVSLLGGMNEVLRTVSESEATYLREGLSAQSRSHSFSRSTRERRTLKTRSKAVQFVTGEDGGLVPGNVVIL